MTSHLYRNVLLMLIGLAAVACGTTNEKARVVVDYKQVANFPDYRLAPDASGSHGAGLDGMFIMYKITQIKNTGPAAKTFVFDVDKVLTVTPDKTSNDTTTDANILLAGQNVTTVTVNAGQVKTVDGCFIKRAVANNPQTLVLAQVPLIHQINKSQPVTMNNLAPNGNVVAVGNALPNSLQSECSSH